MGDKAKARQTAAAAGVPVLPGSKEPLASLEEAQRVAAEVGYPVILKAAAGGGGRGMRIVHEHQTLRASVRHRAQRGRDALRHRAPSTSRSTWSSRATSSSRSSATATAT